MFSDLREKGDTFQSPIAQTLLARGDNLRKGAALNTAQIAELFAKEFN